MQLLGLFRSRLFIATFYLFVFSVAIYHTSMAQELFLIAGQSNAVGQGSYLKSPACQPGKAFEFDASINQFIDLKDPAGKPWKLFQQAGSGSIAPSFANRLNELSGKKIYIVTAARGGASCSAKAVMADYDTWDTSGHLFDLAVEKTKLAEKPSGKKLSGIVWMQGERDANAILAGKLTKSEYEMALEGLFNRFREKLGKKIPIYMVLTAYQQDKVPLGCQMVRDVQLAMSQRVKEVYIAYAETGSFARRNWFKDIVHYNQDALNDIGAKTAEFIFTSHSTHGEKFYRNNWTNSFDFNGLVQPVPFANRFIDSGYYVWCGSVTKGKDGKYYMLYSRWRLSEGFEAWPISSEIAVAVADQIAGPYKHLKVALPARGTSYWDGSATHNPSVIQYKGKYYLYYMGTSCNCPIKNNESYTDNWWRYRNTQRIGVAVADNPDGEWKRLDYPVLDVSRDSAAFDALLVTNPAPAVDEKGHIILVYKSVAKAKKINGGNVRFGVAFAESPLGPYKKSPKTIFEVKDNSKEWMVAEDPYLWFQNGYYLAIVRDVVGKFTGDTGALALLVSKNGKDWLPALHPKVIGSKFYWENGAESVSKLERPCLFLENGIPRYLFGATRADVSQRLSFNVAIPFLKVNQ